MSRFNASEGWAKIGRRHHYFRNDQSLCGDVRYGRSEYTKFEIDPDMEPLPNDCKRCWVELKEILA